MQCAWDATPSAVKAELSKSSLCATPRPLRSVLSQLRAKSDYSNRPLRIAGLQPLPFIHSRSRAAKGFAAGGTERSPRQRGITGKMIREGVSAPR